MGLPQVNDHAILVAHEIRRALEKRLAWMNRDFGGSRGSRYIESPVRLASGTEKPVPATGAPPCRDI